MRGRVGRAPDQDHLVRGRVGRAPDQDHPERDRNVITVFSTAQGGFDSAIADGRFSPIRWPAVLVYIFRVHLFKVHIVKAVLFSNFHQSYHRRTRK